MKKISLALAIILGNALTAHANQELLIKMSSKETAQMMLMSPMSTEKGIKAEAVTDTLIKIQANSVKHLNKMAEILKTDASVVYVQPNYRVHLLEDHKIQDNLRRAAFAKSIARMGILLKSYPYPDNPALVAMPTQAAGADPQFSKQWGMNDIGAQDAWKKANGKSDIVVAVIDTGVDYNHEDLRPNMWINSKEIPGNKVDDDNNGYVDDIVGWDFSGNDNLPFDLMVSQGDLLTGGGNPGHGTHCAGNVAARGNNALGIAGVAPNVKIMAIRFISAEGSGTTADAVKAIHYAVDNGAKVLSNSWGSEGEDPSEDQSNKALRDAIQYAQDRGVLFIAAAGNGHGGVGYDNDTDKQPAYPASYDHDIIISVAALNVKNELGDFSNWGMKSVDIGAPGVDVYSTTVGNNYNNKVIDMGGFSITWDGTSMATPHVAGAAALYWSANPKKSWQEVKAAILKSATQIPSMNGKSVSGGKLNVKALLSR